MKATALHIPGGSRRRADMRRMHPLPHPPTPPPPAHAHAHERARARADRGIIYCNPTRSEPVTGLPHCLQQQPLLLQQPSQLLVLAPLGSCKHHSYSLKDRKRSCRSRGPAEVLGDGTSCSSASSRCLLNEALQKYLCMFDVVADARRSTCWKMSCPAAAAAWQAKQSSRQML